ncbi:hypothetical protein [Enterobacter mori]|uniref:hypothetical protein n=1 Tax=Enterobacter mori TaxID=539813 RepID=UPI0021CAAABF|nr:hypothetical protein [Enterobacter mori]MCU3988425.1 hypothetical protein [Enterobacter mori]
MKPSYEELEARCAALAAELRAVEAIHDEAVFITDDHYEQCPPEVQKMIRSLAVLQIPAYQAFLTEVRAQGVDEFLRGSQLPYQIATVLADYDNVDDATLQTVIWSGQPPEPDGDVWHLEYVSRGNAEYALGLTLNEEYQLAAYRMLLKYLTGHVEENLENGNG